MPVRPPTRCRPTLVFTLARSCWLLAGEEVDYVEYKDPHLVANLLKVYLRELPDPLLTFSLYPRFVEAASTCSSTLALGPFTDNLGGSRL